MNRKSKIILKNLISDVFPLIIYSLLSIVKSKVILNNLGSNILGLYQIFVQLMQYLSLAEGGLGSAIIYSLYTPLLQKDYFKISSLKNGVKKIFNFIIIIILCLGILLSFVIPFIIKNNQFSLFYIQTNFLLYVLSEVILYFTVFENSLFIADEKGYKINVINKFTLITKAILEIIIVLNNGNLTNILIMYLVINILSVIIIKIYSKKYYPTIINKEKDITILKSVKDLFVHKLGTLIANNIDVIILSKIIGLSSVVIYTTYNAIFNNIATIIGKINIASVATIGKIIKNDKKLSYEVFLDFNSLCFFLATAIGIPLFFSINYFINIFYEGKVYTSILISLMFVLLFIYQIIRLPLTTFVTAAGLFKETKYCPIIESLINLFLSLILANYFGIVGVLFSTLIALLISEYLLKPKIIYNNIFKKKVYLYYMKNIGYLIIIGISIIIFYYIQKNLVIYNLIQWFLYSLLIFLINVIFVAILYFISGNLKFINRIFNNK